MLDKQSQLAASRNFITQNALKRISVTATELIDEGELTDGQRDRLTTMQANAESILRELRPAGEAAHPVTQIAQEQHDFLSMVAHELRTPLTSLRGFAQTGLRQIAREGSIPQDRIRDILDSIDQQAERLTQLLAQFREYSRIEAGQLVLDCKSVELTGLTENLPAVIQAPPGKIIFQSDGSVSASVDALRLRQVLSYFVELAIQSSPDGQSVNLEVSSANRQFAVITITDHGGEVSPEQQARLTYQGNHIRGTDLDLHISRQLIRLHKGQFYVEFPPEGGTRFTISLPMA